MKSLSVPAPAKINLFLEVLGKRPDGYHELETVMQETSLADTVELEESDSGIELTCTEPEIPCDERNLAWKAARVFQEESGIKRGVKLHLLKKIPTAAGLGGGSSDAAAVLKGLNTLWGAGLADEVLMAMASRIGSDVPFFIKGCTALCKGRGEIVQPIETRQRLFYVILYPEIRVATTSIYNSLKIDLTKGLKDANFFVKAFLSGDPDSFGKLLFNRLEGVTLGLYPELRKTKALLESYSPCGVLLSGSGSAIYALCNKRREAERIREELTRQGFKKTYVVTNLESLEPA